VGESTLEFFDKYPLSTDNTIFENFNEIAATSVDERKLSR